MFFYAMKDENDDVGEPCDICKRSHIDFFRRRQDYETEKTNSCNQT